MHEYRRFRCQPNPMRQIHPWPPPRTGLMSITLARRGSIISTLQRVVPSRLLASWISPLARVATITFAEILTAGRLASGIYCFWRKSSPPLFVTVFQQGVAFPDCVPCVGVSPIPGIYLMLVGVSRFAGFLVHLLFASLVIEAVTGLIPRQSSPSRSLSMAHIMPPISGKVRKSSNCRRNFEPPTPAKPMILMRR